MRSFLNNFTCCFVRESNLVSSRRKRNILFDISFLPYTFEHVDVVTQRVQPFLERIQDLVRYAHVDSVLRHFGNVGPQTIETLVHRIHDLASSRRVAVGGVELLVQMRLKIVETQFEGFQDLLGISPVVLSGDVVRLAEKVQLSAESF